MLNKQTNHTTMEIVYWLLGLLMYAVWIWSVVIIFRKIEETTTFEKFMLGTGLTFAVLFIIGSAV